MQVKGTYNYFLKVVKYNYFLTRDIMAVFDSATALDTMLLSMDIKITKKTVETANLIYKLWLQFENYTLYGQKYPVSCDFGRFVKYLEKLMKNYPKTSVV